MSDSELDLLMIMGIEVSLICSRVGALSDGDLLRSMDWGVELLVEVTVSELSMERGCPCSIPIAFTCEFRIRLVIAVNIFALASERVKGLL